MFENKNYNPDVTEETEELEENDIVEETVEDKVVEETVEETPVVEEPVEETPIVEAEPEPEPEAEVAEEPKPQIGIVTGCTRLRVRKGPSTNAAVIEEIEALDEVTICDRGSTSEFYKVRTASGNTGYCMKKFITLG